MIGRDLMASTTKAEMPASRSRPIFFSICGQGMFGAVGHVMGYYELVVFSRVVPLSRLRVAAFFPVARS